MFRLAQRCSQIVGRRKLVTKQLQTKSLSTQSFKKITDDLDMITIYFAGSSICTIAGLCVGVGSAIYETKEAVRYDKHTDPFIFLQYPIGGLFIGLFFGLCSPVLIPVGAVYFATVKGSEYYYNK